MSIAPVWAVAAEVAGAADTDVANAIAAVRIVDRMIVMTGAEMFVRIEG